VVRGLRKSFGDQVILDDISFSVLQGQTLAVLGRSGCGKTTLLRTLAGIHQPDTGQILMRGADITGVVLRKRDVVYLYQEPLLFPHLSAFENVAFGLRLRRTGESQVHAIVKAMLERLDLSGHGHKAPHELSGGQRQRVSFGRALIVNPSLLLLDEPFGSLDAQTRASMQVLFRSVATEFAITAVFVTHDLKEALVVGDELARIRDRHLVTYPSKKAFVEDPESGVAQEVDFWESVRNGRP